MITLRSDVQRPLFIGEIDGNFSDLDGRIRAIETVAYAKGDAVLVTYDAGVTYVQMAARTDLPAGTALDYVDAQGNPAWVAVSLRQRTAEYVYSSDVGPRHVGGPLAIPRGLAGSVARLDTGPVRSLSIALYAQAAATGSALRLLGAFNWEAGAVVATRSGPGGLMAANDTVSVLVNGSTRPLVVGLAMTIVGAHV